MLDIKFVRENPDIVKENIRKKFQNAKLPLVDEAIALDAQRRQAIADGEALKAERNKLSKANGPLFGKLKKCTDEAEKAAIQAQIDANNAAVKADADRMAQLEAQKEQAEVALNKIMLVIPQIIDESVPIGPDDSCNVEVERFGEPKTPDFEVPYHTDIMERFDGIDLDAAGRYVAVLTAGRLDLYTRDLELYASLDTTGGARDVVLRSDGTAWLITGETARLFIPE